MQYARLIISIHCVVYNFLELNRIETGHFEHLPAISCISATGGRHLPLTVGVYTQTHVHTFTYIYIHSLELILCRCVD